MKFPFPLTVVRKRVKHVRIKITSAGTVELVLPWFFPRHHGLRFVAEKQDWILKKREEQNRRDLLDFCYNGRAYQLQPAPEIPKATVFFRAEKVLIGADSEEKARQYFQDFIKRQARKYLPREMEILGRKHALRFSGLTLRVQKTRWGSCSTRKTISLNVALMRLSKKLREYVLIHELCHTKEMNHSRKFWKLVEECCPEYRNLRQDLKRYQLMVSWKNI